MISLGCKADFDCHGHGKCNQESGKCGCADGYIGNTCDVSSKCASINILNYFLHNFTVINSPI